MPSPPSLISTDHGTLSPQVSRVLDVARSWLGERGRETGNNEGPVVEWSMEPWTRHRPDGTGWARWCAAWASRCWLEAWPGFKVIGSPDCDALYRRCKERGWTRERRSLEQVMPGDILFWGEEADITHVSLCQRHESGVVFTIGGNEGNRVRERQYVVSAATLLHAIATPIPL